MYKFASSLIPYLFTALIGFSSNLSAGSKDIDQAINWYHAGQPGQAITILKPLAMSGNIDAQILLGNITYAQSKSDPLNSTDNPVEWYMIEAWRPLLFCKEDQEVKASLDPVAPAKRSEN